MKEFQNLPILNLNLLYGNSGLHGSKVLYANDTEDVSIYLRLFIDFDRSKHFQNYILAIRLYSYGKIATIDVVSLHNKEYQQDIAREHARKVIMNEGVLPSEYYDQFEIPMLVGGGSLEIESGDIFNFFEGNSIYGNKIFDTGAGNIASYVAWSTGFMAPQNRVMDGENFVRKLLRFMQENSLKKNFYHLVQHILVLGEEGEDLDCSNILHRCSLQNMRSSEKMLEYKRLHQK